MNGIYMVIYVGRVDNRSDSGLKDSMVEHLKEYTLGHYFEWNSASNILDAYKREKNRNDRIYENNVSILISSFLLHQGKIWVFIHRSFIE